MPYGVLIEVDDEVAGRVDAPSLERMIEGVLAEDGVDDGASLALVIADDVLLRELNQRHRDVDAPTDVLSFPASEGEEMPTPEGEPVYLGDVVVSLESVERQAAEAGLEARAELDHVVLHGVLHLLGYDHEEPEDEVRMRTREEAVLGAGIHAGREGHAD